MRVTINETEVSLFKGATLKHALLKFDQSLYHRVLSGEMVIRDQEGNQTDVYGAAMANWSYYIIKK
ncbi:hypothetical protein SAMN04488134_105200 [Amphibacillus marinus]|uniref:Uncharacterized protein n=1 Tax=Amphibacillus marinus TaxID=872970 RepID=A0A1H8NC46_9BACI|nr:hypothetical protein [Amphibacillus marinus]SEO27088.1 hypothetical protein SAMN04488134_105200 [Amphibacillus marinus]